jgi:hypothetical protein
MSPQDLTPGGCPERHELPALLGGELRTHEVHAVRDHLVGCAACRAELVEQAAGHSLLVATGRTLRDVTPVQVPQPPARPVPAVRARDARRRRLAVAGAAAAVVLVAGGVVVGSWSAGRDALPTTPNDPAVASGRQADLEPVGPVRGRGVVTMAGAGGRTAEMTVETHALPRPGAGSYYYAWLLDPETQKMLPIGQVQARGRATFRLPLSLLGRYTAIDVSLETDDGDPGHSPTSVLRARYTPPTSTTS